MLSRTTRVFTPSCRPLLFSSAIHHSLPHHSPSHHSLPHHSPPHHSLSHSSPTSPGSIQRGFHSMATPKLVPNTFCSYCGTKHTDGTPFPRECGNCHRKVYVNPTPVAVCVLPVDNGVLVIRRNIHPQKGQLAFPGGFVDVKESWQQAAVRELFEETGITIDHQEIEHYHTASAPDADVLLIFGICRPRQSTELAPFVPNHEVTERLVLTASQELAFSLHTDVITKYFSGKL